MFKTVISLVGRQLAYKRCIDILSLRQIKLTTPEQIFLNNDSDIADLADDFYEAICNRMSYEQIRLPTPELLLLEDYKSN